ncbi:multidrug effflux MFS transporter [Sporocytophaga myxococcoides]|uniref:multidrug effflux MFS transporter n=1 Tax=Sporocytophaga myxococcoides TaxID=153721 RepID=UPI0003F7CCBD|nr:multidrug effflux MFS transporter [Sporocytophaga myxococcoides]
MRHTQNKNVITLILGMLATVSPFAIDFYLPAFSQIAEDLQTSTARISLSVSSYFIGMALGQLIYGPLLDRYGRKPPLFAGLIIFVIASLGCTFSYRVEQLIILRFIQALGGSVAGVAAMAMVKDFFTASQGPRIFAMLILTIGLSPLLAPSIGGFVAESFNWKAVFVLLAFIAVFAMTIVFLFLPEGQEPDREVTLKLQPMAKTYVSILSDTQFFTYTVSGSFAFATLFIYVAGSPIVFIELFHVSPQMYGAIFALLSVGFIGASQLNILLVRKFPSNAIFRFSLIVQVLAGFIFLMVALYGGMNLYSTILMLFIFLSCVGLINPNASTLALAPFTKNIGSAAAMLGCSQIGIAALASIAVGLFKAASILPMIASMVATSSFALFLLWRGEKKMAGKVVMADVNSGPIAH